MKTITINCFLCKTSFEKYRGEYDRQMRLGHNNFFCSQSCRNQHIKNVTIERGKLLRKSNETLYYENPKKCLNCQTIIPYKKKNNNVNYCSSKCAATHTQKDGGHCHWSDEDKKRISNKSIALWKENYDIWIRQKPPKKILKGKCVICKKDFEFCPSRLKKHCSFQCYIKAIKNGYLKGKSGGYRERGGRGKQGWYKGYYCHSTWELAWVIYNLEHNISFSRNKLGFEYIFNGNKHKFYPDFIVNDEYVEIKGWDNGTVSAKLSQFPYKLTVLRTAEMKPYIEYAVKKYGPKLEMLYENKNTVDNFKKI